MTQFTEDARKKAKDEAESESRRADQKQHADKLLQGFAKIDDNAPNRAIWELVQNACDLTKECEVIIDYRNGKFAFSHNGKPFTSKTLIALIKQVSSKGDGETDEVGRFGTGFITTHAFGRKFTIDSMLDVHGQLVQVEEFLVDRTPMEWQSMVVNLEEQEKRVYDVIENGNTVEAGRYKTTLTYLPGSEIERKYVENSYPFLEHYIPLVLTISERLVSITVINSEGVSVKYAKGEKTQQGDLWVTPIMIDDDVREVFSLIDPQHGVEVILPLRDKSTAMKFDERIARLFLHYPLVGTEDWGCNYIIHSANFRPTEPRDGIHLKSNNEQVKHDEESNRSLIERASNMIFDFVSAHVSSILGSINFAQVEFNVQGDTPQLNEYFSGLKSKWIERFTVCPLVETEDGHCKPIDIAFLAQDLLLDANSQSAIYSLAKLYWQNLPQEELTAEWANVLDKWGQVKVQIKGLRDLAIEIEKSGTLSRFSEPESLRKFYRYAITNGHSSLFNERKLLPNLDGDFRQLSALNAKVALSRDLVEIARILAPEVIGRHIDESFILSFDLAEYTRADYAKDLTAQITAKIKGTEISTSIEGRFYRAFLDFCKISSNADADNVPIRLTKLICKYNDHDTDLIVLPTLSGTRLDNRTAQEKLLQVFLNDIASNSAEWVEGNLRLIEEVISTLKEYSDLADFLKTARLYPNQYHELCLQSALKIDKGIPLEMKEMYDRICKPSTPINGTLILPQFAKYLSSPEGRYPKSVGADLESMLSEDGHYGRIDKHPFKDDILQLIQWITENPSWGDYFPHLDRWKANVMLETVSGSARGAMFNLMKLPSEKLEKLGAIAEQQGIERLLQLNVLVTEDIVNLIETVSALPADQVAQLQSIAADGELMKVFELGLREWEEERRSSTDFAHKHAIGTHLEAILRKHLSTVIPDELKVEVRGQQNGQDMVVRYKDRILYFIEVKSRWNSNSPVRMSRNQTIKANEQSNRYALCTIDMAQYKEDDRYQMTDIHRISSFIRFNQDIGSRVGHLAGIMAETESTEPVRLDGDLRTHISMDYVKEGIPIGEFEQELVNHIRTHHGDIN